MRAFYLKKAAEKQTQFPELMERLLDALKRGSPFHALAVVACHSSLSTVREDGTPGRKALKDMEQHHLELLQALTLSIPGEELSFALLKPGDFQEIFDLLVEVAEAFHMRRFMAAEEPRSDEARALLALQERIRLHTQAVRNWGPFGEVVAISTELYAPLDGQFERALGFTATGCIKVCHTLVSVFEKRMDDWFQKLRRVLKFRKPNGMVRRYYREFLDLKGSPEDLLEMFSGWPADSIAAAIMSHVDLRLEEVCTFLPEQIAEASGQMASQVKAILDAISVPLGAFPEDKREHFFLTNPMWQTPVIRKGEEGFFCPVPQSIFSHIHSVILALAERGKFKEPLERQRARYLEEKVGRLLKQALPDAVVKPAVKWKVGQVHYETDHLAKIGSSVLIVEDKSAALTAAALRGAPDRVRRHLKDLVLDPSEQSARLEDLILQARAGDLEAIATLAPFGLDLSDVERVARISVTLDDFSVSSAEIELKEVGLLPKGVRLAPTLNVADLQCVVDILDSQILFLDYFIERERVQKALHAFADEIDYLGLYLKTAFNIWAVEEAGASLMLTGMSQPIDVYCNARDAGISRPKPRAALSPYFARLLEALETRQPPGWMEVGHQILRAGSFDEQRRIERMLEVLRRNVTQKWRDPHHECSIVISPPKIRDTILMIHAYPPQLEKNRRAIVENLLAEVLNENEKTKCIVISRNLDHWNDQAYSAVVVAKTK